MRVGEGWEVAEVNPGRVSPLIVGCHYLHKMPAVVPCAMALSVDGWIQGALVWALPPKETAARYGAETWELARLWLRDELPRNSESWFISRCLKHLRVSHPAVRFAVSYADPAVGHVGTIYKATNWRYEGMTDSERKTPRWDYLANGKRVGRAAHGIGLAVTKVRRLPKHRYSMELRRYGHAGRPG